MVITSVGLVSGSAGATSTTVSGCQTIDQSGTYVLGNDITISTQYVSCIQITASDVVFDGMGHTIHTTVYNHEGVLVDGSSGGLSNVTVRNLTVSGWEGGIVMRNVTGGTVTNVVADDTRNSLLFDSGTVATVTDAFVNDSYGAGVYGDSATVTVTGTTITNTSSPGVDVTNGSTTLRNVDIWTTDDGIVADGNLTLRDSHVVYSGYGVYLGNPTAYQSPVTARIENNTLKGDDGDYAADYAVVVDEGVNATIVDNEMGGWAYTGIWVDYDAKQTGPSTFEEAPVHSTIARNNFSGQDTGVEVSAENRKNTPADVMIRDNSFNQSGTAIEVTERGDSDQQLAIDAWDNVIETATTGISVEGADARLSGNYVNDTGTGVVVRDAGVYMNGDEIRNVTEAVNVSHSSVALDDVRSFDATTRFVSLNGSQALIDGGTFGSTTGTEIDAGVSVSEGAATIRNAWFGHVYYGTSLDGTVATVENVTFYDSHVGATLTDSEATLDDVEVYGAAYGGWLVGSTATVTGGEFHANIGFTLHEDSGVASNLTVDASLVEADPAVEADPGSNVTVRDATLRAGSYDSIVVDGTNLTVLNTTITNSPYLHMPLGTGVLADLGSNVTLRDSRIENATVGIRVNNSTATIADNQVVNASQETANITDSSASIVGNFLEANNDQDPNGVDVVESDVTIVGNTISIEGTGVWARRSAVDIVNNTIHANNAYRAIEFDTAEGNISNNTIDSLGRTIYLSSTDSDRQTVARVEGNQISTGGTGVTVRLNTAAVVENNDIEAEDVGVEIRGEPEAHVVDNRITVVDPWGRDTVGIELVPVSVSYQTPAYVAAATNTINATTGIHVAPDYPVAAFNPYVTANDFAATDVAINNSNASRTVWVPLNYYGPRGPTDDRLDGLLQDVEPFLTAPQSNVDQNWQESLQTFGYDLEYQAGGIYTLGTPASLERNLSETFGDFDGAVYLYDETTQSWSLATGDETLGPMEPVVVVPNTDARAVVDFRDVTPAQPTEREVVAGWNFVSARHYGPAEGAFSTETTALSDLVNPYGQAGDQPSLRGDSFGHYAFTVGSADPTAGPRVSPFAGYFVYATDSGTIPASVFDGITYDKIDGVLDESQDGT